MPNQRAAGQVLINIPMKVGDLEVLNSCVKRSRYENRSAFVRDAIREKLLRLGFVIDEEAFKGQSRVGKGGPKPRDGTVGRKSSDTPADDSKNESETKLARRRFKGRRGL
jgi:Arc/MetJ-type ribon-helix-helix transcriptional regulator